MKEHNEGPSNKDVENSVRPAVRVEHWGRRVHPASVVRSLRGITSVQLLLVMLVFFPLGGTCVYPVAPCDASTEDSGKGPQRLTLSQDEKPPLGVLSSLDTSDERVDELLASMRALYTGAELSSQLNTRGFYVYTAEKSRAIADKNSYSRQEIQRAFRWFERARQLDASAIMPPWNAACMCGLLGNVNKAIIRLDNLKRVLPVTRTVEFAQKVASDTDFCPIERHSVFSGYLRKTWKVQRRADCPKPPIQTR